MNELSILNEKTIVLIRTLILAIGWPVLIAGSVILYIKGRNVYKMGG